MKQQRSFPRVTVSKKAARAIKGGHPWVFEGEVRTIAAATTAERGAANLKGSAAAPEDGSVVAAECGVAAVEDGSVITAELGATTAEGSAETSKGSAGALEKSAVTNGDVVDVVEENGTYLGTGLFSEKSKIRVRIVSRNANDRFDDAFWRRKLQWAWDYRVTCMGQRALPGCEPDTNCCRVLFSEADGFPGLIVDRYEDVLVAQVGTVGMQRLRPVIYPLLIDVLEQDGQHITGIYERNDAPARTHEGLSLYKGWWDPMQDTVRDVMRYVTQNPMQDLASDPASISAQSPMQGVALGAAREELCDTDGNASRPTRRQVRENGIVYDVDFENSQKTGFFLDQKYNRRAIRELSRGRRVLDCFSHVGPFGLNAAAGGAEFVRCVDVSETATTLARENARLNGLDKRMAFTTADVFDYLPELASDKQALRDAGGPFDLVILDPPAFTKSRATVRQAQRGYREINYEALRLLPRGGYLATCSCSHFMTTELLQRAIAEAAHDAGVQLKQIEQRQQAPDHPVLWGVPETHYLDFFIFQVV